MSVPERLYGLRGAETMHSTPAEVYESRIEPYCDEHDMRPWIIEEWTKESTVDVARRWFLSSEAVIEHIIDCFMDEYGAEGDVGVEKAESDPEALKLADALITHLADMVRWRRADKKVAEHTVTWDADGEPLLDGEPMYRQAADRDGGQ
jgi:hypothetical protein